MNRKLTLKEGILDGLQAYLLALQTSLLLSLLLDNGAFNLTFCKFLRRSDSPIQVKPDIFLIILDQFAQLG